MIIKSVAIILLLVAVQVSAASPEKYEPNKECPAPRLLPVLDSSYHECNRGFGNGSCDRFIDTFRQLTQRYDCQRSFDTGSVPAVWLAGDAELEDYIQLLLRLAEKPNQHYSDKRFKPARAAARSLFGSKELQGILDGYIAEDYLELSKQVDLEGAE